jgi:hypothetical protein
MPFVEHVPIISVAPYHRSSVHATAAIAAHKAFSQSMGIDGKYSDSANYSN